MGNQSIDLFVEFVKNSLLAGEKKSRVQLESYACKNGISDKTVVKELIELAIVKVGRNYARGNEPAFIRFQKIVELFNLQATLSHRTSNSILLQQYSTSIPISFLAGWYCGIDSGKDLLCFEPSAGNGMLTVAGDPKHIVVNELDQVRLNNLKQQGFKKVFNRDAGNGFPEFKETFDVVLNNPPFGNGNGSSLIVDGYPISALDHKLVIFSLNCLKDSGKAALIIGGHTKWDTEGRVVSGRDRIFLNYLYSHYNVDDVINIDGRKLYYKQGTGFPIRLILVSGRKKLPTGNSPLFDESRDEVINSFGDLFIRVEKSKENSGMSQINKLLLRAKLLKAELEALKETDNDISGVYTPASDSCIKLNTQVPDGMAYEIQEALSRVKELVGGDIDNFVRHRLGYTSKDELCQYLAAEQIDAVALCIYNFEAREQAFIIGDQTGIGKGREAAAIIRYAVLKGLKPIFLTEKPNLFSDIYRDLSDIGSGNLRPFILNSKDEKSDVKDINGKIIFQAPDANIQKKIFEQENIGSDYDFVLATYSQLNSPGRPVKQNFISKIAEKNILILDEAHNSSGSSNTGYYMRGVVSRALGVVFLSATFAKRPDNMPVFAVKTAISECNLSHEELINSILKGGVPLQEVLSAQLVKEGQMIRRERSSEGIETNYVVLEDEAEEHRAIADNVTSIIRDIIEFQKKHIKVSLAELDREAAGSSYEVKTRGGTDKVGIDNTPYFSKVYNVIGQMLFSIKAKSVAARTIMRLKEGKSVVIAFQNTMGSFIEQMENEDGLPVTEGDLIDWDFSAVLRKGLDGVLRYTVTAANGEKTYSKLELYSLPDEAVKEYNRILKNINQTSTGISISPIDVITKIITSAGYKVAEVTGRKYCLQYSDFGTKAEIKNRARVLTNDAFRSFNNNEADVLLINQAGSTGASAHAIATKKVSPSEVRQRWMIILQPDTDISIEVQKRGRINRTGQLSLPGYDYLSSAIPAELRMMMMLQKKLKSLDANTASNQKQSAKLLDVPDFLNKYGDSIVKDYLGDNPEIDLLLDFPLLGLSASGYVDDACLKVSGRVAVLSTKMQEEFYSDMTVRYNDFVEYKKQVGEYDLEVEALNLEAELKSSQVLVVGSGTGSSFGGDSFLETVEANVLRKPFTKDELNNILIEALAGKNAKDLQKHLRQEVLDAIDKQWKDELEKLSDEINPDEDQEDKKKKGKKKSLSPRERVNNKYEELWKSLRPIFDFFYIGRKLFRPYETGKSIIKVPAVFLGFTIDKKKRNPYTLSAIKLRFAIADSNKYLSLPASYGTLILAIMGASVDVFPVSHEVLLDEWEKHIFKRILDKQERYIITGNILQSFSKFPGKLVSYTTIEGQIKKGILMPEYWNLSEEVGNKMSVPIAKALSIISSLNIDEEIKTTIGLTIVRSGTGYYLKVLSSKSEGGNVYLNQNILSLVKDNNFQKVSNMMIAELPDQKIESLVNILQVDFNAFVEIVSEEKNNLDKKEIIKTVMRPIILPPTEKLYSNTNKQKVESNQEKNKKGRIMSLRARALLLELELLALAS